MSPQTFIFIGRSGSGKGTQSTLIQEFLKKNDPSREILYIQTGAEFRTFIQGETTTEKLSREIYHKGEFQPEFLAVYMWANVLVNKYTAGEHLVLDGMPRKHHEAGVLDSAWSFYRLQKPHVAYLDISKEEATKRLLARKRFDDNEEDLTVRLSWFDAEVLPTLEFFRNNPNYNFFAVDGSRPMEEVHREILEKANLA